jgi:hypothetical protein
MKITVQDGEFTYSYDSSVNDKIEGGFLEEYYPPVEEALEAAIALLWNVYDRVEIAKALLKGIPAMEYANPEFEQKSAK